MRSGPNRSWPATTTCPPPGLNTSAASTAITRPALPTTKLSCWQATTPNASFSPPAAHSSRTRPETPDRGVVARRQYRDWVLEVIRVATESDERVALDIYNAGWP